MSNGLLLRVFVYGTLKVGHGNHARYCRGFQSVHEAQVHGRLFQLPAGYPMLIVPESSILSFGTRDFPADVRLQQECTARLSAAKTSAETPAEWDCINGEVLAFDDPARLQQLDELEDYVPGRTGEYQRVLIALAAPPGTAVWTYIAPDGTPPSGAQQIGNRWPPDSEPRVD